MIISQNSHKTYNLLIWFRNKKYDKSSYIRRTNYTNQCFKALYNPLFLSYSLTVRIYFNTSNSSTNTSFSTSSFFKVLITLHTKLVMKEVIAGELETQNQIVTIKE